MKDAWIGKAGAGPALVHAVSVQVTGPLTVKVEPAFTERAGASSGLSWAR